MLHAAAVMPGPATATVIQSAARGGRAREAFVRHRANLHAATGTLMVGFGLRVLADQR